MKECKHTFRHWAKNKLKIVDDISINVIALTAFALLEFKQLRCNFITRPLDNYELIWLSKLKINLDIIRYE